MSINIETEAEAAAFGDLVGAVRHGRFKEAARHRQRLYRLGWVVSPRASSKSRASSEGFEPLPNEPDHAKFVKPEHGEAPEVPPSRALDSGRLSRQRSRAVDSESQF